MLPTLPGVGCPRFYWSACTGVRGALYAPVCAAGESRKVDHMSHVCTHGLTERWAWRWASVRLG